MPLSTQASGDIHGGQVSDVVLRLERDLELLEIIASVAATDGIDQAYQQLVDSLQQWLDTRQLAIGVDRHQRSRCHIKAISGTRTVSRQSPAVRCLEAVMNESLVRGELDAKHLDSIDGGKPTVLQKELAHLTNSTTVVNGPLRDAGGRAIGAWVALDDKSDPADVATLFRQMHGAEARVALCLAILSRSRRRRLGARHLVPAYYRSRRGRRLATFTAFVFFAAAMAYPMHYKVSCSCSLQPVMRRYVVAPYEGMLEKALVEPGDRVSGGQIVARMDGREIQWELAGLEAEYNRARKEHDTNLAGLDTAATQLSLLEMERLQLKIRLLEHRAHNLEIKSPVAGVVIGGDPKKMEGARLTIGQTLLEIGPMEQMVAELAIADEDISHVKRGQALTIRFPSQPRRDYASSIAKIHPRAQTHEQSNVFIAEARLENTDGSLRPGMQGRARIRTAKHPVAWNLFHKVWQRVAFRMGW